MKAARFILNILVCAPLLALQAGAQDKPMVTAYPTESPPTASPFIEAFLEKRGIQGQKGGDEDPP